MPNRGDAMDKYHRALFDGAEQKVKSYRGGPYTTPPSFNYALLSGDAEIIFWGKIGARSDFIPYAVSKAEHVVHSGHDQCLVDPQETNGYFVGWARLVCCIVPRFLCCCTRLDTVGAQAVRMFDGRVGAFSVHGSPGNPQWDMDVCISALEFAGFVRRGSGKKACWELPVDKLDAAGNSNPLGEGSTEGQGGNLSDQDPSHPNHPKPKMSRQFSRAADITES